MTGIETATETGTETGTGTESTSTVAAPTDDWDGFGFETRQVHAG